MNIEGRCYRRPALSFSQIGLTMLTVWVPAKRSARFYGHHVRQNSETDAVPQELLPSVSHIRITSLRREVANRHLCNSARSIIEIHAAFCQSRPPPALGRAFLWENPPTIPPGAPPSCRKTYIQGRKNRRTCALAGGPGRDYNRDAKNFCAGPFAAPGAREERGAGSGSPPERPYETVCLRRPGI